VRLDPAEASRALTRWLIRHRRAVLAVAALVSLPAAGFGVRLYANLRSGFEELLPDTAPSVVAARTIGPLLHTVTHLSVVLEGPDGDALDRFADDLAPRLRALPTSLVESVEYRTDADEAFLRRFGGLYLSTSELEELERKVDERIALERRKANPFLGLLDDEPAVATPAPDLGALDRRLEEVRATLAKFRKGYYQTPDGRLLVLLIRPPESATGLEQNRRVLEAVRAEVEALAPAGYGPGIRVGYDGEVASLVEEQAALVADLLASTAVVLVLVLAVLWLYFRRWSAIAAIVLALASGCALTFGLSWLLIGYLNANTAFLGSIVVGNGINVSIILVARYLEERERGLEVAAALEVAVPGTLVATFLASFAAAISYLSLSVTSFRGFSQFGLIGGLGMALCWVTSYLLLPPILAVIDGRPGARPVSPRRPVVGAWISELVHRRGGVVRAVSILLLVASGAGLLAYRGDPIEYDLAKLRAARSARDGAQYWGGKVDQVFKEYLTPIVVRADTPAELARVTAELERARSAMGAADPIREVRTLVTAVPSDQARKLAILARVRDRLTDARIARMSPETRAQVLRLRPPPDLARVTLADLTPTFRLPLVERDGTAGRIALVFPRKVGQLGPLDMQELSGLVRGSIARSGAAAQAVGQSLLFVDIAAAILGDGPRATALALVLVVALVALTFRRVGPTLQVVGGLLLGVGWLVGAAAWSQVKLNFLNFVVLPVTFGIGVDYAANILQRVRLEGAGSLDRVLRETGGAVALCSMTTIIGYASLVAADNRALRGFGVLASFGEVACVAAALVALPAFLLARDRPPA
jgi:predicted RND superfamily exporter protein